MTESFPCIICGESLERVMDDFEAQPSEGIMCSTSGNYGSTVFDPLNGEKLAFNICDPCVIKAGEQGRIMTYVAALPVSTTVPFGEGKTTTSAVGWMRVDRPYVPWNNDLPESSERVDMDIEEILLRFDDKRFTWNLSRKDFEHMWVELTAREV